MCDFERRSGIYLYCLCSDSLLRRLSSPDKVNARLRAATNNCPQILHRCDICNALHGVEWIGCGEAVCNYLGMTHIRIFCLQWYTIPNHGPAPLYTIYVDWGRAFAEKFRSQRIVSPQYRNGEVDRGTININ